jgi:hypothetical protein
MWKPLQALLLCLGLVGASTQILSAAPPAARPQVTSLTMALEDGRTYSLRSEDLSDDQGGVIFWGDWAVYNILFPFCIFHGDQGMKPKDLVHLWNAPAPNGEQPAFILRSGKKFCYPLNPAVPGASTQGTTFRSKVVAVTVGYADGRRYSLNNLELYDERSGVMFWKDFSVNHMLVPFYAMSSGLPTTPGDVISLWNGSRPTASSGPSLSAATMTVREQPGFLLKPQCIPQYSMAAE